jgi:hypothetical protein
LVGALITPRNSCSTACNGLALAASAAVYWPPAPFISCTKLLWNADAWALSAWKFCAWPENSDAIAADTSSWAAATIPVVGAAAVALASPIVDPMRARSDAAALTYSGAAITNDICVSTSLGGDSTSGENLRRIRGTLRLWLGFN